MKCVRTTLLIVQMMLSTAGCNQFPPIGGSQADEANDVVGELQEFLRTQPGENSIQVLGRGGNRSISIYVYGAHTPQVRQSIVEAMRKYVDGHPLRKDLGLKFYDSKSIDGKDGVPIYSCVIPKHEGP